MDPEPARDTTIGSTVGATLGSPLGPYAAIVADLAEARPQDAFAVVRGALRWMEPSGDEPRRWEVHFDEDHPPEVLDALRVLPSVHAVCVPPAGERRCADVGPAITLAFSAPRPAGGDTWEMSVLRSDPMTGGRAAAARYVYTLAAVEGAWRVTRRAVVVMT